jgi:hypothetical protein
VITRIFGLVIRGQKTDGLVAYADMLNHKKPRDAADTDTRSEGHDMCGWARECMSAIDVANQLSSHELIDTTASHLSVCLPSGGPSTTL